jgi:hypothetical protein
MSKMMFETNPLRKYCNFVFHKMAIKPHLDMTTTKDEIKIIGLEQFENVNPCRQGISIYAHRHKLFLVSTNCLFFSKSGVKTHQLADLIVKILDILVCSAFRNLV